VGITCSRRISGDSPPFFIQHQRDASRFEPGSELFELRGITVPLTDGVRERLECFGAETKPFLQGDLGPFAGLLLTFGLLNRDQRAVSE
jgi:hypothetical protein